VTVSPQDLSLRQLEYVVAVADTLGFHRAAERCHVSQPTLSAQVKQIEGVLGVSLFERDRRRVLVTPAGEAVILHARRVLLEVADLLLAARQVEDPGSGVCRIGVIPTIAPYLLHEVVPDVRPRFPKLRFVFRESKTEHIVAALRDGELDAGLVALEADIGDWAFARIATDEFVVAMPKGHRLAKKKRVAPADLEGEDVLLLDEGHCFRTQALSVCKRSGAKETEFRATSLATLAQMVSAGSGITLLPSVAVPVENRGGQLDVRPFTHPRPHRTLALIWRPQSPLAATLRALGASFAASMKRCQTA
jgi:LysR family hydrogen peroxide-inducible transcriptional activator